MVNLPAHSTPVAPFDLPRVGVDAIVIVFEDRHQGNRDRMTMPYMFLKIIQFTQYAQFLYVVRQR
jgi:hypothetical protein